MTTYRIPLAACALVVLTLTACTTPTPEHPSLPVAADGSQLVQPLTTEQATAYGEAVSTPCVTEDSRNCHWQADVQGNGRGRSFIDVLGIAYYYPAK